MKKYLVALLISIFLVGVNVTGLVAVPQSPNGSNTTSSHSPPKKAYAKNRILIKLTENAIKSPSLQQRGPQKGNIITGLSLLDKKIKKSNVNAMRKAFIKVKNVEKDKQLGVSR